MGIHRLWLGQDHLLQVHARLGIERYQRFYFSDIQALTTRKTQTGKVYNGLLAAVALILILPASELEGGWSIFFYCAAGLFLTFLAVNGMLGPTCKTHLRTAVQLQALPSLHRLNTALRVMDRLRPLIQAKQGLLSRAQVQKGAAAGLPASGRRPNSAAASVRAAAPRRASSVTGGHLQVLLSAMLMAQAAVGAVEFFINHVAIAAVDAALFICTAIAATVFVVRQYDAPRQTRMLALAWSTMAYVGLRALSGYVIIAGVAFKKAGVAFNQWHQFELLARISPRHSIYLMAMQIFFVTFATALAVAVLIASKKKPAAAPEPAEPGDRPQPQTGGRV